MSSETTNLKGWTEEAHYESGAEWNEWDGWEEGEEEERAESEEWAEPDEEDEQEEDTWWEDDDQQKWSQEWYLRAPISVHPESLRTTI